MRFLIGLLALVSLCVASAQSEAGTSVVLRVDERSLSLEEFDQRFDVYAANLAAQQGIPLTPETRPMLAPLRPQYLEQLATEFVLLEEARRRGLEPDEEFADEQVATIRESFETDEAFQQGLQQAGFADEVLLRTLITEAELIRRSLEAFRQNIEVRDYQLELYYDANRENYQQEAQVCARHILVETRPEAEALESELAGGADFATLAQEHSIDTGSAERGGDLGCFPRGMMVASFEEAAFDTPVGEVGDIIESRFGFHLILPYDRTEAMQVPLEEVRDEVRTQVERSILQAHIENLRETADVELDAELVAPEVPEGGQ